MIMTPERLTDYVLKTERLRPAIGTARSALRARERPTLNIQLPTLNDEPSDLESEISNTTADRKHAANNLAGAWEFFTVSAFFRSPKTQNSEPKTLSVSRARR